MQGHCWSIRRVLHHATEPCSPWGSCKGGKAHSLCQGRGEEALAAMSFAERHVLRRNMNELKELLPSKMGE